jgi:hypothetical protein
MNIQYEYDASPRTPLDNLVIFGVVEENIFTVTVFVCPLRGIECAIIPTLYSKMISEVPI